MPENFGLKIGLEGEKEFKKSLAEINNSFKVLLVLLDREIHAFNGGDGCFYS